ncbi:MAG: RICIN domain-containing protein [Massilia sp.]
MDINPSQSSLALAVLNGALTDGAAIVQASASTATSQRWLLKKSTSGAYNIVSVASGKSLTFADSNSGTQATQSSDTASGLQRWFLNPVSGQCGGAVAHGFANQSGADGLATTTGGGSAAPVTVTSCSALTTALQSTAAAVVQIPANTTIDCHTAPRTAMACAVACGSNDPAKTYYRMPAGQTCTSLGSSTDALFARSVNDTRILVGSNKTLIGLDTNAKVLGATLELGAAKNVIIRNLTIEDINPGLVEAGDGIGMNGASHIWIDHVTFNLISDGHVDMYNSKNVTLSWNNFKGQNPAVCGGQHYYTNLVENSVVTFDHNYWQKTAGRNPKLDGAATRAHIYNNYWLDLTYFAINANSSAQAKVEGDYFANTAKPHWNVSGLIDANISSNRYTGVSATDTYKNTGSTVFGDVTLYPYTLDAVDNLPGVLGNSAGAR